MIRIGAVINFYLRVSNAYYLFLVYLNLTSFLVRFVSGIANPEYSLINRR
jgi:hypothetical protein